MRSDQKASALAARPNSGMAAHAVTLGIFFGAAAVPTPLYRLYQESFALSPVGVTIVFAVYAIALLAALLVAGSLSDHLGRRPVILGALVVQIAAMALFLFADGAGFLIAARVAQGIGTGIAMASLGAALVDADRERGQFVNSLAPFIGMSVGAIVTSALIQYGPFPLHLVYFLLLVAFGLAAVAVWLAPETGARRPGALASLWPRVAVPAQIRRPLALVSAVNVATWMLGGFYLSLVPKLVAETTGSQAPLVGGAVVGTLMAAAGIAITLRRAKAARANLIAGAIAMAFGVAVVVLGVNLASIPVLLIGTLIAGAGFGTSFLGSLGLVLPLAKPDERAGLLSALYVESYLAFSLPAILAGYLVKILGYDATADIYGLLIAGLSLGGVVVYRTARDEPETARDAIERRRAA